MCIGPEVASLSRHLRYPVIIYYRGNAAQQDFVSRLCFEQVSDLDACLTRKYIVSQDKNSSDSNLMF